MNLFKNLLSRGIVYLLLPFALASLLTNLATIWLQKHTSFNPVFGRQDISSIERFVPMQNLFLDINPLKLALDPPAPARDEPAPSAAAAEKKNQEAPPKRLDIELLGIWWHDENPVFWARHDKQVQMFRPGDAVGHTRVEEVFSDLVVFADGTSLDPFDRPSPPKADQQQPAAEQAPSVEFHKGRAQIEAAEAERIIRNPNLLLSQVAIAPSSQGGYFINWVDKRSVFGSILQRGDIIKRINGVEAMSPRDLFQILESLDKRNFFSIDIERDGERKTLVIEVKR